MEITKVREICYVKAREYGFNLYCPVIENTRLSRTLGRVCWDKYGDLEKIEFSAKFLASATEHAIMETILHELAHAFVFLETGEIHGHDAMFRSMCARLGTMNNGMHAKCFELNASKDEYYKYTLYCSKCGKPIGHRQRACKITQHPEQYLSSCCRGEIRVEMNW